MSSLPQRFTSNALANYLSAFASLLLAVLVTPIMVRGLGKDAYGVWGLATSTVLYFDLLKFGFGRATVKYVAAAKATGDVEGLRKAVATATWSLMVPGAFVLLMSPVLGFLFPVIFDVPQDLVTPAIVIVILSCVDMALAIPSDTFGGTLIGLQRYDLLNLTLIGTAVAQAAAWTVVIALGGGLIAIGIATLAFSLVGQASRYVMARRLTRTELLRPSFFERALVKPLLSMSGWIAVNDISDTVIARIDAVVVGIIGGVGQAAVYLVGQKLSQLAARFTSPVSALFYPHASELHAIDDREALRATVFTGTRISIAVAAPLMLVLAVLAEPALEAWVGPGFSGAAPVVIFLSATLVVSMFAKTVIYVLRGMGDVRVPALFAMSEALVNLPLSIVLGLSMGYKGVALATLIATTASQIGLMLPYGCRRLQISPFALVWAALRGNLPAALAATAVGLLLHQQGIHGLLAVLGAGALMLAVYVVVLFATGLTGDERRRLVGAVRRRAGMATG